MRGTITVFFQNQAMIISQNVADVFNLKNNAEIATEEKLWNVLSNNCRDGIAYCEKAIRMTKDICKN